MSTVHVSLASMYGEDHPQWRRVTIGCPGCGGAHTINVPGPDGERPPNMPCWEWNENPDRLTVTPSILSRGTYTTPGGTEERVCHSFFTDGQWHYLDDCTHDLAGQTADPTEVPEWMRH